MSRLVTPRSPDPRRAPTAPRSVPPAMALKLNMTSKQAEQEKLRTRKKLRKKLAVNPCTQVAPQQQAAQQEQVAPRQQAAQQEQVAPQQHSDILVPDSPNKRLYQQISMLERDAAATEVLHGVVKYLKTGLESKTKAKTELDIARMENESLKMSMEKSTEEVRDLTEQRDVTLGKLENIEGILKNSRVAIKQLSDEKERLQTRLQAMEQRTDEYKKALVDHEARGTEVAQLKAQLAERGTFIGTLRHLFSR